MKSQRFIFTAILFFLCSACSGGHRSPAAPLEHSVTNQPTSTFTPVPTNTPTEIPTPVEPDNTKSISMNEMENGWPQYTNSKDGFSIAIPQDWVPLDLSAEDITQLLATTKENNPQLSEIFPSSYLENLAASGTKFIAIDGSTESLFAGVPSSVNISIVELPGAISLDNAIDITVQQLESVYGGPVEHERIEIGGIETEKISYEVEMNDAFGSPQTIVINQYAMIENNTQYAITCTTLKEFEDVNTAIFSKIAESFKLAQ